MIATKAVPGLSASLRRASLSTAILRTAAEQIASEAKREVMTLVIDAEALRDIAGGSMDLLAILRQT